MPDHQISPTVEEKLALLAQPPEARLLILNGDDLGMCHAANAATFDAMERGLLTAASLMLPCPWAYAACAYARSHPQLDIGVHLTLTSEWQTYRWGPLLSAARWTGDSIRPTLMGTWGPSMPTRTSCPCTSSWRAPTACPCAWRRGVWRRLARLPTRTSR